MSVSISLFAGAGWQFFDSNGVPLAGGLLYTYAAGTTTPQATYTTSAGSIANANPIVLDSAGRTANEIWLTDGSSYKFILKTSTGTQIGSYDNISGGNDFTAVYAALAASSGSSLIGFIQPSGTAETVQAKLRQIISVKDYGATGDGTTDDTAAFSLAISTLAATGKSGRIDIPAGTYKLTSGITIDASVCTLVGYAALLDFSSFTASTGAAITVTGAAINYVGNPYFNGVNVMQGLKIQGPGQEVAGNIGVKFTGSTALLGSNDYAMRDCEVFSFDSGIILGDVAYHLLFDHCSVFLCSVAVTAQLFSNAGARNVFHRCSIFNSDYGFALYNRSSGSTDITDCVIAGISLVCILIEGGHLSVTNCDFEPGGSHGALYRTLWVTATGYPSYSYINWHGNQVSVKNATSVPIYAIDGAGILTMTGGYLISNTGCTGGVFGSAGAGVGTIATFNWSADYGSNPITNFAGASIETYIHQSFSNSISASTTDATFGSLAATLGITSSNGVFANNNNSIAIAALSTFTSFGVAQPSGLLILRDGTSAGTALFLCDPSAGVTSISNTITGATVSYSGGQLGVTLGSGTVPRIIRWTIVETSNV